MIMLTLKTTFILELTNERLDKTNMVEANLEEREKAGLVLRVEISFNTSGKVLLANLTSLREREREQCDGGIDIIYTASHTVLCSWDHV